MEAVFCRQSKKMADYPNFSEPPLTARERALQEKIIRLEKRLEGFQSQIGNTLK